MFGGLGRPLLISTQSQGNGHPDSFISLFSSAKAALSLAEASGNLAKAWWQVRTE
jgi:hypothetical protein